jgi:hypothetical protein
MATYTNGEEPQTGTKKKTSATTAGPVAAGSEGANFITTSDSPRDWLSTKDDTRWGATKTAHDPCPTGYRVPTAAELDAELNEFSPKDIDGAFESALKLSAACRRLDNGNFEFVGSGGFYWSSTVEGVYARNLYLFHSGFADVTVARRNLGYSVRCIKE